MTSKAALETATLGMTEAAAKALEVGTVMHGVNWNIDERDRNACNVVEEYLVR